MPCPQLLDPSYLSQDVNGSEIQLHESIQGSDNDPSLNLLRKRLKYFKGVSPPASFNEFQSLGAPQDTLGILGDIYIDMTQDAYALHGRTSAGWSLWPGPDPSHPEILHFLFSDRHLGVVDRNADSTIGWIESLAKLRNGHSASDMIAQKLDRRKLVNTGALARYRAKKSEHVVLGASPACPSVAPGAPAEAISNGTREIEMNIDEHNGVSKKTSNLEKTQLRKTTNESPLKRRMRQLTGSHAATLSSSTDTTYFEFQGLGALEDSLGKSADVYVDVTPNACALYGKTNVGICWLVSFRQSKTKVCNGMGGIITTGTAK
ncbi:hypothetical protein C8J56DRAFT_1054173 [Mycena floridula]|nr:hypothetical protein C8J56DRAFT_1054173 [Mycena floridula]